MQNVKRVQPDIRAIARLVPPDGNLVQGQNEVPISPALAEAAARVIAEGFNHYSFIEGVDDLRVKVAEKIRIHNGITVDPAARPLQLMITPGGTGALVIIAQTFLRSASCVVFDPYYSYHKKILAEFDSRVDVVKLSAPEFLLDPADLDRICRAGVARADKPIKAIIVSSPANPTGKVFSLAEMQAILDCAQKYNLLILSDEVYEHFTLAAEDHISIASLPGAFERTITVNSFSKSWAISGWRLGFVYGPPELVGRIAPTGNVLFVCAPTPLEYALARVLLADPDFYDRLRADFIRKRNLITDGLEEAGFSIYPSRSTFYVWARIPERYKNAMELNELMIRRAAVGGVPGSAFQDDGPDLYMRFCVARQDERLKTAVGRIVEALAT